MREVRLLWARTLKRLDVSARTLVALIEPGSCFAGLLAELVLAADRSFMLDGTRDGRRSTAGDDPADGRQRRLRTRCRTACRDWRTRFWGATTTLDGGPGADRQGPDAADAVDAGLVTFALDDLDWDDEVRVMLEERNSFSPDALTGMEANLPLRRARDHRDQDLRPPHGVAELDLPTPERRRPRGCAAPLRHRFAPDVRPSEGVTRHEHR